jgi:hypothetical protein
LDIILRDKAYLIGITLIGITFIACVLSFWLLFYGVFTFAIGAILIFLSKKSIKKKLLVTILPIIFYLPTTYLFLLAYNYTPPKTFLIPADYEGIIRIVYEEKCGVEIRKENGRQILQFPESGILVLKEKFNGGINNEYFLIDKSGKRTKIEEVIDFNNSLKNIPFIVVAGGGTVNRESNNKDITFTDFHLYSKDTAQIDDYPFSERLDSLMWKVVEDCRASK